MRPPSAPSSPPTFSPTWSAPTWWLWHTLAQDLLCEFHFPIPPNVAATYRISAHVHSLRALEPATSNLPIARLMLVEAPLLDREHAWGPMQVLYKSVIKGAVGTTCVHLVHFDLWSDADCRGCISFPCRCRARAERARLLDEFVGKPSGLGARL